MLFHFQFHSDKLLCRQYQREPIQLYSFPVIDSCSKDSFGSRKKKVMQLRKEQEVIALRDS